MADFPAAFVGQIGVVQFLPLADPVSYGAVFVPYTHLMDTAAPVATLISPAIGNVDPHTPIVVEIIDNKQLARVTAWVEYQDGDWLTMYARGRFAPQFDTSTVEEVIPQVKRRFT